MASINTLDVRVTNQGYEQNALNSKAARGACRYLRRAAECTRPSSKEELAKAIWQAYWVMVDAEAFPAHVSHKVRRMLRSKYGCWVSVNVQRAA